MIKKYGKPTFSLFLQLMGYGILIYCDWRIAIAMFLLHWAINIERKF